MSGQVEGCPRSPRDEYSLIAPARVPVLRSKYEATEMMPHLKSCPAGFVGPDAVALIL
jgi:hypothetical protein